MTDRFRDWAAAYVLGALEADERAEFEDHLGGCDDCRAQVASLAPIPALLARSAPPHTPGDEDGALHLALAEVASERRRLQRSRRWWKGLALGSVAASLVLLLVAVFPGSGDDGVPEERVRLAVSSTQATAEIDLLPREWGSVVDIHVVEVSEAPGTGSFTAWVVDDAGAWSPACTWGLSGDGWARVQGASAVPVEDVAEVVVTPTDDRTVAVLRAVPVG